MKKAPSAFVILAGCVAVSLFAGCAGPKGFSVRAPEKPVLNYAGIPYDEAWKDLVAFMEGDAKWCMGSIEDMSKEDGFVRTAWRSSHTSMPYQTRVMARFNDARDRVEFTPEALFESVPGYSAEIAEHLKTAISLHDSKRKLAQTKKIIAEAPSERQLPPATDEDREMARRLVGTWKAATTSRTVNQLAGKAPDHQTMEIEETEVFRSDGTFSSSTRSTLPGRTIEWSSTGTWVVRGNEIFSVKESRVEGTVTRSNTHSKIVWRDDDHFEKRNVPDEISQARDIKLGVKYTDTYAEDGTRTAVSEMNGGRFESVTTPCIFRRLAPSAPE